MLLSVTHLLSSGNDGTAFFTLLLSLIKVLLRSRQHLVVFEEGSGECFCTLTEIPDTGLNVMSGITAAMLRSALG